MGGAQGWQEGGETRQIPPSDQVLLGPKGDLLAHATLDQGYLLFSGKEEYGPYMWISGVTASGNGKSLAWAVSAMPGMNGGDMALDPFAGGGMGLPSSRGEVYLDGELVSLPEDEAVAAPRLNRDGKRLAYIAQRNEKVTVVWRGKAWSTTAGDASSPVISPDGKKVAVVLDHQVATASAGLTMLNTNWLDGGMEASFGPDGSIAMRVADGSCRVMIDDEQVAGPFKRAIAPVWSPDSKQVAVRVQEEEGWRVAVGGHLSELYEEVGPPRFDEKGTKVAFGARKGQELHWVLMELTGEE